MPGLDRYPDRSREIPVAARTWQAPGCPSVRYFEHSARYESARHDGERPAVQIDRCPEHLTGRRAPRVPAEGARAVHIACPRRGSTPTPAVRTVRYAARRREAAAIG